MFDYLLKKDDTQDKTLNKIKADIWGNNEKLESHSMTIKQVEQQFIPISTQLIQHQKGIFPSNTMQNLKNDGQCISVTIRAGKQIINPPMLMVDNKVCEQTVESKDAKAGDDMSKDGCATKW